MSSRAPMVHDLREPISTPADGIVSRTIYQDDDVSVVLFSFAAGQQLSDHSAAVAVTLEVIDGEAEIDVAGEQIAGRPGTWMHLAAAVPHSVQARTPLTLLLTMLRRPA